MPRMPLRSRPRPPPAVRRAPLTRLSPPPRRRSPAAMRPTRRSTGCSVARSRSKSKPLLHERRRALRGVFFRLLLASMLCAAQHARGAEPRNFLFADSDDLGRLTKLLERPDVEGVQIVYSWRSLEPEQDQYDFSRIEADLAFLHQRDKRLFAQIQDRFFEIGARNVPAYLLDDPRYGGGLAPQSDN